MDINYYDNCDKAFQNYQKDDNSSSYITSLVIKLQLVL